MRARWGWFVCFPFLASLGLLVASQFEFLKSSFYKDLGLGRFGTTLGLGNYATLLGNSFYLGSIKTTLELSFYATAVGLLFAYPVAYTIARMRSKFAMVMIAAILLASFVTVPIKVLGLIIIFAKEGMLNRLLLQLHVVDSPVTILGSEMGVVIGLIYYSLAFAVLLLYSVIKTIPVSLQDAAKIHGCGEWRAFWKVVFPLSLPGIIAVGMTVFNLSMGGFAAAALMGGGRVLTLPVLIYRMVTSEARYGIAATLSMILLALVLLLNVVSVIVISFWVGRRNRKLKQRDRIEAATDAAAQRQAIAAGSKDSRATSRSIQMPRRTNGFEDISDYLRQRLHRMTLRMGTFGDWLRDHGVRIRVLRAFNALGVGWVYLFLFAPLIVVALASLNGGSTRYGGITFPPAHISLDWYLQTPMAHIRAFGVSVMLGLISSSIALLLALPASLGLTRGQFPGKEMAALAFRVPLQIPFIIIGVSFLYLYYAIDTHTGLSLANSFVGLVLAHVFVLMPYIVNSVSEVLRRFNVQLEEAALILGAGRWRTFCRVTLPVIVPGVFAGTVYAFMVSFGDVPIALMLAGSSITPLPMMIYQSMEVMFDATLLSTSTAVMILGFGLLLLVQRLIGLGSLLRSDASAAG